MICKNCGVEFNSLNENSSIQYCPSCFDEIINTKLIAEKKENDKEFVPLIKPEIKTVKEKFSNFTIKKKQKFFKKIGTEYVFSGKSEFKLAKKYNVPVSVIQEAVEYTANNGITLATDLEKKMKIMESRKNKETIYKLINECIAEIDANKNDKGYIANFTRMTIIKAMKEVREFMTFEADILAIIGDSNSNADMIKMAIEEVHSRISMSGDDLGF